MFTKYHFQVIVFFFPWQHYILRIGLGDGQQGEGMELAGIPEGIPSLAEYLAEYCHAAVSHIDKFDWIEVYILICPK